VTASPGPTEADELDGIDRVAELEAKVAQLEHALDSRIVIEQAKGILAERLAVSVQEAFDILRYAARSNRMKLHHVAGRVVNERATPAPIVFAVARASRARAAWMRELAEAHRARVAELHAALWEQLQKIEESRRRAVSRGEKRV
jgi:hypothetical protein